MVTAMVMATAMVTAMVMVTAMAQNKTAISITWKKRSGGKIFLAQKNSCRSCHPMILDLKAQVLLCASSRKETEDLCSDEEFH